MIAGEEKSVSVQCPHCGAATEALLSPVTKLPSVISIQCDGCRKIFGVKFDSEARLAGYQK